MDYSFSQEQLAYKEKVIAFAKEAFPESYLEADLNSVFSKEAWMKCAEFGLQGLAIPKEYGGTGDEIDLITACLAMEGLGYACRDNGLAFGINAQLWTVEYPIVLFGTEEQKKKYLPRMAAGEWMGCHALSEPDAGSDVYSMKTTATKVDGGYLLNGHKHYITFGPVGDVILVFATTDPNKGAWGITAFMVEKGMKGFTQGENRPKMGLRTVPFGDLFFEDCFVPEENRLGPEGAGWSITNSSLEHDRCTILAGQLGTMQYQLEETVAYVRKRKQYGQAIGKFQSVSNRVADMKLRLELSKLLLYKVAWMKNKGETSMMESALLKLYMSESFIESSLDAIRNHGAPGYISEFEVERNLRDAVGGVIYAGTSDIQRNIISKLLGL
ncbi:acyl-CoA dehydrogenase family protein [Aureicoccus marinus]|uniref:Acyl-CoA dehydrogenase n=1 Tax=Aureicoccus marinus TaxID=754435 RepID=A0A2S7T712_9FLAO|nr:acyl-CoA dehydrogenase family protein [Aureicoccus marinus]PQJ15295.1 acyl-CoA dehydrogenase [Aureicoccus marinus]